MKFFCVSLAFLLAFQSFAEYGIIETSEGKLEGDIRFEANGVIITGTNGTNRVEAQQLTHLRFQPPPANTNAASAAGSTRGLRGTYFSRDDLTGTSFVRIDPAIDFDWGLAAPFDGLGADNFSVRWEGEVEAPTTGLYTFIGQADDSMVLYIDGQLMFRRWDERGQNELSAVAQLEAGKRHSIKLEYRERDARAFARLYWFGPSLVRSIVPPQHFTSAPVTTTNVVPFTPTSGLMGMYFNEPDLSGPFRTRYDSTIDYDWGEASPFMGVNSDRFSVRWTGTLTPALTEHYTFHTVTDDGVRLWIDNRLVIDSWREEFMNLASVPMVLQAGKAYDFKMEMFDAGVRAVAKLFWSSPSIPRQTIPKAQFRPGSVPNPSTQLGWRKVPPGISLMDGSVLACSIKSADESSFKITGVNGLNNISVIQTARVTFHPVPADALAALPGGRPGLLLANRDFIEGDFRGVKNGKVQLYSVLFGLKTYDLPKVIALILREPKTRGARFEIVTRDDSRLLVPELTIHPEGIQIQGGLLSGLKIPLKDLVAIKAVPITPPQTQARL